MAAELEQVKDTLDQALAERLVGNEHLRAGELDRAMSVYWSVLLKLKGLDCKIANCYELMAKIARAESVEIVYDAERVVQEKRELIARVKSGEMLCFVNMAAIQAKKSNWNRALDSALKAQKIEPDNPKAKFREGQARIGLGQTKKGEELLRKLYQTHPDQGIILALNNLKLKQKGRDEKSKTISKGMFSSSSETGAAPLKDRTNS